MPKVDDLTVDDLKEQTLFQGLGPEELAPILEKIQVMEMAKGSYVFKESDATSGIYMVKSGKIEIKRKLQLDTKTKMLIMLRNIQSDEVTHTSHGWEHKFAVLGKGQFFGELSVIENRKKHSAECVAMEDSTLMLLKSDDFFALESTNPASMARIMRAIAKSMSANVRQLDKRILKSLMGH